MHFGDIMYSGMTFTRGFMDGRNRPGWKWRFSCMEDFNIWLVLDGSGRFWLGEKEIPLSRGVCLIIPPGAAGYAEQDTADPLHTIAVHFVFSGHKSVELPPYCRIDDVDFLARLMGKAVKCAWTSDRAGADYWLGGIVSEIRHGSTVDKNLRSHQEEIEALCWKITFAPERQWKVADLARQTYLCREHFSKLFRQFKGVSPQEFIIKARLDRASHLLLNSYQSITEIASSCGYSSEFFFSRQFKHRFGITPSAMRKSRQLSKLA